MYIRRIKNVINTGNSCGNAYEYLLENVKQCRKETSLDFSMWKRRHTTLLGIFFCYMFRYSGNISLTLYVLETKFTYCR